MTLEVKIMKLWLYDRLSYLWFKLTCKICHNSDKSFMKWWNDVEIKSQNVNFDMS